MDFVQGNQTDAGVNTVYGQATLRILSRQENLVSRDNRGDVWIPQMQVTELRVRLNTAGMWRFSKLSVQQVEFAPAATLVVNYQSMNPNSIDTTVLHGKDQDVLAFLPTQVSGARADPPRHSAALAERAQQFAGHYSS